MMLMSCIPEGKLLTRRQSVTFYPTISHSLLSRYTRRDFVQLFTLGSERAVSKYALCSKGL